MHVIDALIAGGAERMAVNLANAVADRLGHAHLCVTRKSGVLEPFIKKNVQVLWLHRRATIDPAAFIRFLHYISRHGITHVHAHSTSLFIAALLKPFGGYKLIWHDHYGRSEQLAERPARILKMLSPRIDYVCSVNDRLKAWAVNTLGIPPDRVTMLPNYADLQEDSGPAGPIPGEDGSRIASLASFRPQKDHGSLLQAFRKVVQKHPDWHLLLIGQPVDRPYADSISKTANALGLSGHTHFLGARTDVAALLGQCEIGVLSSRSEGLPVALLEYGLGRLAVACTNVGQCADVVDHGNAGVLVPPGNPEALADALCALIQNPLRRDELAGRLNERVRRFYSRDATLDQLMTIYRSVAGGDQP